MADDQEKFSLSKFFSGFLNPVTHAKNIQFVLWAAAVCFAGFTIYRAYFVPTNKQVQTTHIEVTQGGTLNLQQNQKQEVKKRAWWIPTPFVEAYGFTETTGRAGAGARIGARLEF